MDSGSTPKSILINFHQATYVFAKGYGCIRVLIAIYNENPIYKKQKMEMCGVRISVYTIQTNEDLDNIIIFTIFSQT
jgi:hypothetical protein